MTDDAEKAGAAASEDAYERVALACAALARQGATPGPRAVHRWLTEQFGRAIQWQRISPLIAQWETSRGAPKAPDKQRRKAAPEAPPIAATLERHPSLTSMINAIGRDLADLLDRRAGDAAEERLRALELARAEERAAADAALAAAHESHAALLAARDATIRDLREAEAEMGAELERAQQDLVTAVDTQEARLATLEAEVREWRAAAAAAEEEASRLRGTLALAQAEVETARRDEAAAKDGVADLKSQIADLRRQLTVEHQHNKRLYHTLQQHLAAQAPPRAAAGGRAGPVNRPPAQRPDGRPKGKT